MSAGPPDCFRCRFFYVSHDPARPHGCRVFGFKSALLPAIEVRRTSGHECAAFEAKPPPPPARSRS